MRKKSFKTSAKMDEVTNVIQQTAALHIRVTRVAHSYTYSCTLNLQQVDGRTTSISGRHYRLVPQLRISVFPQSSSRRSA